MSTTSTIIIAIAAVLTVCVISFVVLAVAVVKHQQKMLAGFGTDDFKTIVERKAK